MEISSVEGGRGTGSEETRGVDLRYESRYWQRPDIRYIASVSVIAAFGLREARAIKPANCSG